MRLGGYEDIGYEDIVGLPDEVVEDASWLPNPLPPLRSLMGHCFYCGTSAVLGKARFSNEVVTINESETTIEAWLKLSERANHADWKRVGKAKSWCDGCDGMGAFIPGGVR